MGAALPAGQARRRRGVRARVAEALTAVAPGIVGNCLLRSQARAGSPTPGTRSRCGSPASSMRRVVGVDELHRLGDEATLAFLARLVDAARPKCAGPSGRARRRRSRCHAGWRRDGPTPRSMRSHSASRRGSAGVRRLAPCGAGIRRLAAHVARRLDRRDRRRRGRRGYGMAPLRGAAGTRDGARRAAGDRPGAVGASAAGNRSSLRRNERRAAGRLRVLRRRASTR